MTARELKRGRKPREGEVSTLNVKIDLKTHEDVRAYALTSGMTVKGIVEQALKAYLKAHEVKE